MGRVLAPSVCVLGLVVAVVVDSLGGVLSARSMVSVCESIRIFVFPGTDAQTL